MLVVNADDLGYCAARDRGIFEAFRAGVVSSVHAFALATRRSSAVVLVCNLCVCVCMCVCEYLCMDRPPPL